MDNQLTNWASLLTLTVAAAAILFTAAILAITKRNKQQSQTMIEPERSLVRPQQAANANPEVVARFIQALNENS